jgi:hypothetical protein
MDSMMKDNGQSENKTNTLVKYTLKVFAFIVFLILSPFIFLGVLWLGFKMLVLNDSIDIKPILNFLAKKLKDEKSEFDDIDFDDIDDSDLVMLDVEDITYKKN